MRSASRDLRTLLRAGAVGAIADGPLLERFIAGRDNDAFEALVVRHGPMVWGVCRRVLGTHHDAEDAFQASFLVLARKAASIRRRETVASWLYAVAYQTALKARSRAARRRLRERQVSEMPEPQAATRDPWLDLEPLLDQELSRLPEAYRGAIILCDLEGKSRREAAEQLGWPEGTLSSRLSRGRGMLARRLARHGLVLSGGALAAALSEKAASARVATSLVDSTVRAAASFAAGHAATTGLIAADVTSLAKGVLKTMLLAKLKITMAAILALGLAGSALATGGPPGLGHAPAAEGGPPVVPRRPAPAAEARPEDAESHEAFERFWMEALAKVHHTDAGNQTLVANARDCKSCHAESAPAKLKAARERLLQGRHDEALRLVDEARSMKTHWGRFDDTPVKVESAIEKARRKATTVAPADPTRGRREADILVDLTERQRDQLVTSILVDQSVLRIREALDGHGKLVRDRKTAIRALEEIEAAVRAMRQDLERGDAGR